MLGQRTEAYKALLSIKDNSATSEDNPCSKQPALVEHTGYTASHHGTTTREMRTMLEEAPEGTPWQAKEGS